MLGRQNGKPGQENAECNKWNIQTKAKGKYNFIRYFQGFDSVEWPTLKMIIKVFVFGKGFKRIDQLYSENITAVNDEITEQVSLDRGIRQGCPLFPSLFTLVI